MKVLLPLIYLSLAINIQVQSYGCDCPSRQIYDSIHNKCIPDTLPPNDPQYIKGCYNYQFNYKNKKELICNRCKPNYYYKEKRGTRPTCIKTDLVGCYHPALQNRDSTFQQTIANKFINKLFQQKNEYRCLDCMGDYYSDIFEQCQPIPQQGDNNYISHCHRYKSSYKNEPICKQCKNGYYLIDKKCVANPTERPNCQEFYWSINENITKCQNCHKNFYLDQNHECQPYPTNDPGCNYYKYFNFANSAECLSCKPDQGYAFDDLNHKCLVIKDEVPFCNDAVVRDGILECYGCEQGYYISNNNDQCFKNPTISDPLYIPNCKIYRQFNEILQCYVCQENYTQETDEQLKCMKTNPTVENCLWYYVTENNTTECMECKQGYTAGDQLNKCNKCPLTDSIN